ELQAGEEGAAGAELHPPQRLAPRAVQLNGRRARRLGDAVPEVVTTDRAARHESIPDVTEPDGAVPAPGLRVREATAERGILGDPLIADPPDAATGKEDPGPGQRQNRPERTRATGLRRLRLQREHTLEPVRPM